MTKEEFISKCVDAGFEWAEGEHEGVDGIFVHWPQCPDEEEVVHCSYDTIAEKDWKTIRRFIVSGRDVYGYSRVVGYFSRIENWNPSKLGELRDRQAGSYKISSNAP